MENPALAAYLSRTHNRELLHRLGEGGMGSVWAVQNLGLDRREAVKILSVDTDDDKSLKRFDTEIKTLAALNHHAIVSIYDSAVTPDGTPLFFMSYIEGTDLSRAIDDRRRTKKPFSIAETVDILRPIAEALDYLHNRPTGPILHRDIKPGNILLPSPSSDWRSRSVLTDFGISIAEDTTRLTSQLMIIGTEPYLAPEVFSDPNLLQHTGSNAPSVHTDNYALGLIAFEMLTLVRGMQSVPEQHWRRGRGTPYFDTDRISPADKQHGVGIARVVNKQLNPVPNRRYDTAVEFINALAGAKSTMAARTAQTARPAQTAQSARTMTRPQQQVQAQAYNPMPGTHPQSYPSTSPQAYFASAGATATPAKPKRSKRRPLALSIAAVLALATAGGAYVVFGDKLPTGASSTANSGISATFPKVAGDKPWGGYQCEEAQPGPGQVATVNCNGNGEGIVIAEFADVEVRDRYVPKGEQTQLNNGVCNIKKVSDSGFEYLLPSGELSKFAILVWGKDAANKALEVPVC